MFGYLDMAVAFCLDPWQEELSKPHRPADRQMWLLYPEWQDGRVFDVVVLDSGLGFGQTPEMFVNISRVFVDDNVM